MFKIVRREDLAGGTAVLNEIEAPKIARKARPGQFVILKATEEGERIPLTMADTNPDKGTITVIYMVVGKSTALFKTLRVDDGYRDIIGPLGKPTPIEKVGRVVCVGGGTGIAVLYPIARAMKKAGNKVVGIVGARTRNLLLLEDEMRAATDELIVTTDDGSYGRAGFVTAALKDILDTGGRRPGGRHRPRAHDESRLGLDQGTWRPDPREPQSDHGGRHGDVRGLPRERRGEDEVRLCGRPGVRRALGRLRRADAPARGLFRGRKKMPRRILPPPGGEVIRPRGSVG